MIGMKLRCLLRMCSFGPWRDVEATYLKSGHDLDDVSSRRYLQRECRDCGRREERSTRKRAMSRQRSLKAGSTDR